MAKNTSILTVSAAAMLLLGAAACTPTKTVRGNMIEEYQVADVQPGVDNASDVMRKLGSPTARDPFDPSIWYYIGQETEKTGVFDPKVVEEHVYIARFSPDGTLQSLTPRDGDRTQIPYSRERTPTSGNEVTIMQQLLGNIGRFNKEGLESP